MIINGKNKGLQHNNTTGFAGVTRKRGRFLARATREGNRIHLGSYDTAEQANEVLLAWREGKGYTQRHGT